MAAVYSRDMQTFWRSLFRNDRPVEIEVGSGTGTFVLPAATTKRDVNYLAIEHAQSRARRLKAEVQTRGLANVIVLQADAACVISNLLPDASVSAYHIYFPDPWWKRRHHRRRLFNAPFAAALARTLKPGGVLFVATDVAPVFEHITATIRAQSELIPDPNLRSPRSQQTSFERKGLLHGATIQNAAYVRPLTAAVTIPPQPTFAQNTAD
ncbi:MAG: tRNA (guanosine(46)-N7)-methyltransferase TrmB [Deltaproteobacteria bacterium]|nr:tRNA (guanosine(46)-N7)-methyltransferase TrmB [Deltaproteobacteria bacterium]